MASKRKALIVSILVIAWIAITTLLEGAIDKIIGNNDGSFSYIHYINSGLAIFLLFYFVSRFKGVTAEIFLATLSVAVLLWFLESVCFVLNNRKPTQNNKQAEGDFVIYTNGVKDESFTIEDTYLGAKGKPGARAVFKNSGGADAFSYTFDTAGFRNTPVYFTDPLLKRDAFFYGCSFTMGFGMSDSFTLPAQFAQLDTNFKVHNYGYNSYGNQQLLSELRYGYIKGAKNVNDILVYTFIDDHVSRTVFDMNKVNTWGDYWPYYYEKNGELIFGGTFKHARPFTYRLYKILFGSQLLKYFKINIPFRFTDKHYQFVAQMIAEEKRLFEEQFGSRNFYAIIYPGTKNTIIKYLDEKHVKYFDFSKLVDMKQDKYTSFDHAHPSALTNQLVAEELFRQLQNAAR